MGCCGKAREVVRGEYSSVTSRAVTAQPARESVEISYLGRSAIRIRGPRTGRVCTFRPEEPDELIDRRDAEVLLRTGLFRLAWKKGKSGTT